jgi:hypothetical protein
MAKAGSLGAVALAAGVVPLEPLLGGKESKAEASVMSYKPKSRAVTSFAYRRATAQAEYVDLGVMPDNGDAKMFSDHSGS